MKQEHSRLVYSSDGEHVVDRASLRSSEGSRPRPQSRQRQAAPAAPDDGVVRLHRTKSGRGGKTVTLITGLPGSEAELDGLLKVLKQHCGAGGSRDGRTIEIQGDHRDRLQARLEALGHRVKLAGG